MSYNLWYMNKLIVICGPTCTGKTSLGIKLCKKFNGEVVSADSRQIYKYMDIGTGKMPIEAQNSKRKAQNYSSKLKAIRKGDGYWIIDGVFIHLYDVAEPDKNFSVARFKDAAEKEIQSIWRRGKIPFLVGGTGFYIAAVLGEVEFPRVPPDWKLRRELEKLSTEKLFEKLKKLDPQRAETIDPKNPRRLIRAIEVAEWKMEDGRWKMDTAGPTKLQTLKIGLTAPRETLYQRADAWAEAIVNDGLLNEVRDLINCGYKGTPPMKGIIYQTAVEHLEGKISKEEMLQQIKFDLHGYIRRQLTWFRRDKTIEWFDLTDSGFDRRVEDVVKSYLEATG